jgi:mannobiose 2-epimerase
MNYNLQKYKHELEVELNNILAFWQNKAIDKENGGFYGKIEYDNTIIFQASKGAVLNSRILWSFAAAFNLTKNKDYLITAENH